MSYRTSYSIEIVFFSVIAVNEEEDCPIFIAIYSYIAMLSSHILTLQQSSPTSLTLYCLTCLYQTRAPLTSIRLFRCHPLLLCSQVLKWRQTFGNLPRSIQHTNPRFHSCLGCNFSTMSGSISSSISTLALVVERTPHNGKRYSQNPENLNACLTNDALFLSPSLHYINTYSSV